MPVNPRTPVLVGYGQVNHRETDARRTPGTGRSDGGSRTRSRRRRACSRPSTPSAWSTCCRCTTATPRCCSAQRIGADRFQPRATAASAATCPQTLVNRACAGHPARAARMSCWWPARRCGEPGRGCAPTVNGSTGPSRTSRFRCPRQRRERRRWPVRPRTASGWTAPAYVYPLFEQALRDRQRGSRSTSTAPHRRAVGAVQRGGGATIRMRGFANRLTAEEICTTRPDEPDDQLALHQADELQQHGRPGRRVDPDLGGEARPACSIPSDRWVYPYAGTDAHDTYAISERAELHRSPAIRIGGARALELAGLGIDDMDYVDLYSCFPSAVQVAAAELGLPVDDPARPLTVTGGLTFAGGPWNNYVTHSIATMAELLTANPGHARPDHRQRRLPDQAQLRRLRHRAAAVRIPLGRHPIRGRSASRPGRRRWNGKASARVEAWTTPFDRDGRPEKAFLSVRTPDEPSHAGLDHRRRGGRGHCERGHRRRQGHGCGGRQRHIAMSYRG